MAVLCRGLEKNGMVRAWHGHGMASVNQTGPHCVNQMGKTHSKPYAARHAMCERAFRDSASYWIQWRPSHPQFNAKQRCLSQVRVIFNEMQWKISSHILVSLVQMKPAYARTEVKHKTSFRGYLLSKIQFTIQTLHKCSNGYDKFQMAYSLKQNSLHSCIN
jgi:hypothetical protein